MIVYVSKRNIYIYRRKERKGERMDYVFNDYMYRYLESFI